MWVCLPVEVFVVKITCWEVSSRDTPLPPLPPPAVNRPMVGWLWIHYRRWQWLLRVWHTWTAHLVCQTLANSAGLHSQTSGPVYTPTPPHPCRRALQSQASGISGLSALLDPLSLLTAPPPTPQVNSNHALFRQARRLLEAFARVECPTLRCRRDRAPVPLRQKSQPLEVGTTRSVNENSLGNGKGKGSLPWGRTIPNHWRCTLPENPGSGPGHPQYL